MDYQLLVAFVVYFAVLIAIGALFYHKTMKAGSFALGGRALNYWVTAISAQSSDMGSWLFLGYTAMIYTQGLMEAWTAVGLVVFMIANWYWIAPRLRMQTEQLHSQTLPTFFDKRFNDTSGTLSITSSLIALIFFLVYISSNFVGLGSLFESTFGIDYYTGIIIASAITIAYTLVGGFLAVAWCNLFQGLFLLAAIVIVPIIGYLHIGSYAAIEAAAQAKHISLSFWPSLQTCSNMLLLIGGYGLGYFGQPHIIVNFMSIDNVKNMRKAMIVGIIWQIVVLCAAIAIGLVGIAMLGTHTLEHPEHLFPLMVQQLFSPLMAGFVLCGVLAAVLSSLNTQIIVAGSSLAEDIYLRIFAPTASNKHKLWISRMSVLLISLVSVALAFTNSTTIYALVQYAWSGLGASFGPLIILSLYSKRMNRHGALIAILFGAATSGLWPLLGTAVPSLIPGFFGSLMMGYIVSLIFPVQKQQ